MRARTRRWGDIWVAVAIAIVTIVMLGLVARRIHSQSLPPEIVERVVVEINQVKTTTESIKEEIADLKQQIVKLQTRIIELQDSLVRRIP